MLRAKSLTLTLDIVSLDVARARQLRRQPDTAAASSALDPDAVAVYSVSCPPLNSTGVVGTETTPVGGVSLTPAPVSASAATAAAVVSAPALSVSSENTLTKPLEGASTAAPTGNTSSAVPTTPATKAKKKKGKKRNH